MIDGRLTDMGTVGTPERKRASRSHDYRRGFAAGAVVTASAASVLMLAGFVGMGGVGALGDKLEQAAERDLDPARDDHGTPRPFGGADRVGDSENAERIADSDNLEAGFATGTPTTRERLGGSPSGPRGLQEETGDERRLREEDELVNENYGGRDLGLDELVRTQQHNRKVLKRGDNMFNKLLGRDDADDRDAPE